ncbi:DAK2 domain-containing protein [Cellulomonas soli]|uniref:DAK2 domain-containing protein n=1 Tax=Cellulomonas soli TaxID=931535 RepID=UPI003F82A854
MGGLDGAVVRAWACAAHDALLVAHERIDSVNVFPVADADTGTNVLLTLAGGRQSLDAVPSDAGAGQVAAAFAHGALLSARGNSGIILSQYLAGLARELPAVADAGHLADAFAGAARCARDAVADPQEGTVLTIARDVAHGARAAADAGADTATLLDGVLGEAHSSLARISSQHPVLRAAHVLDAGACALLVVLDALARVVRGRGPATAADLAWLPTAEAAVHGAGEGGPFEVMLLVRGRGGVPEDAADPGAVLRGRLHQLGDSVAVVGADGWWHVHVHTDDPAAAVEACAGGLREQVVVRLVTAGHAGTAGHGGPSAGVVVCTASPQLAPWYAALGAVVVLRVPESAVAARHLQRALVDAGTGAVTVLTGGAVDHAAVSQACEAVGDAAGHQGTGLPAVRVVDTGDELGTAVGLLALTGGASAAVTAADAETALARLHRAPVHLAVTSADHAAEATLAALDAVVARWPRSSAPPEHATVLHGHGLTHEDAARLAVLLEPALGIRHPSLEVLVLGPVEDVDGLLLGVD